MDVGAPEFAVAQGAAGPGVLAPDNLEIAATLPALLFLGIAEHGSGHNFFVDENTTYGKQRGNRQKTTPFFRLGLLLSFLIFSFFLHRVCLPFRI